MAVSLMVACNTTSLSEMSEAEIMAFHNSLITIDSHTDTPLQFTRSDFDFSIRHDPYNTGSKVDLPRMDEGMLDAIFMAVFVGQKERTPEGNQAAYNKSRQIFDSIFAVSNRFSEKLEIACSPKDVSRIEKEGKHSIYIGIENGYVIGNNLSLIDTFAQLGTKYITLCHTKNNDICDSSTDPEGFEHNGLSEFGSEVVERMNELGIMIDLSHSSDKTFYDVIALSKKPVIASHSCAKAICDNPRNLDDNMLRALAKNGGVIQMCILSSYVETPLPNPARDSAKEAVKLKHGDYYNLDDSAKNAFVDDWYAVDREFPEKLSSVKKVVDHIDHIVAVAGIDYVGIGTDFDGGGELEDCYDVSQLPNITKELISRGYSEKEIRKIWGGNLLRVMKEQG